MKLTVSKECRDYTKPCEISPDAARRLRSQAKYPRCSAVLCEAGHPAVPYTKRSRASTVAQDASAIGTAVAARVGLAGSDDAASIIPYETAWASSAVS